jgi:hypothetical protein
MMRERARPSNGAAGGSQQRPKKRARAPVSARPVAAVAAADTIRYASRCRRGVWRARRPLPPPAPPPLLLTHHTQSHTTLTPLQQARPGICRHHAAARTGASIPRVLDVEWKRATRTPPPTATHPRPRPPPPPQITKPTTTARRPLPRPRVADGDVRRRRGGRLRALGRRRRPILALGPAAAGGRGARGRRAAAAGGGACVCFC